MFMAVRERGKEERLLDFVTQLFHSIISSTDAGDKGCCPAVEQGGVILMYCVSMIEID